MFEALSSLSSDKALGLNGFTMAFWDFCWDFTKTKIMALFEDFFRLGTFPRSLNSTLLVLIPKKKGAEGLKDFRPISLVGGLYKLLAQVLTNRLKSIVGMLVSNNQCDVPHRIGEKVPDAIYIKAPLNQVDAF